MCRSFRVPPLTTLMVSGTFCTGSAILLAVTMISESSAGACDPNEPCVDAVVCADANVASAHAPAPSESRTAARSSADSTDLAMINPLFYVDEIATHQQ